MTDGTGSDGPLSGTTHSATRAAEGREPIAGHLAAAYLPSRARIRARAGYRVLLTHSRLRQKGLQAVSIP